MVSICGYSKLWLGRVSIYKQLVTKVPSRLNIYPHIYSLELTLYILVFRILFLYNLTRKINKEIITLKAIFTKKKTIRERKFI